MTPRALTTSFCDRRTQSRSDLLVDCILGAIVPGLPAISHSFFMCRLHPKTCVPTPTAALRLCCNLHPFLRPLSLRNIRVGHDCLDPFPIHVPQVFLVATAALRETYPLMLRKDGAQCHLLDSLIRIPANMTNVAKLLTKSILMHCFDATCSNPALSADPPFSSCLQFQVSR